MCGPSAAHGHICTSHPAISEDNAAHVIKLWQDNGGRVKLFPKEGGDHYPHGLPDPKPLIEVLMAETK